MSESAQYFTTGYDEHVKKHMLMSKHLGTRKHPEIMRYFEKTPKTIVCPHFYELNWAYGCNFDCAYCYLQGTFRGNKEPRPLPLNHIFRTLQKVFNDELFQPSIFNSGELTDSLVFPSVMEQIVDEFEEQNRHKILILTKSCSVGFLCKRLRKQTIVSFSINAPRVAKKWEHKAPSPEQRIEAAKKVNDEGYETRIRIDPIFPIENWKEEYAKLVDLLFSKLTPSRITLGTPRGLYKTLQYAKDISWAKVAFDDNPYEKTGWGKKMASSLRKEIYGFFYDKLCELGFDKSKIGLCKETETMWRELGLNPGGYPNWEKCKCNCVW